VERGRTLGDGMKEGVIYKKQKEGGVKKRAANAPQQIVPTAHPGGWGPWESSGVSESCGRNGRQRKEKGGRSLEGGMNLGTLVSSRSTKRRKALVTAVTGETNSCPGRRLPLGNKENGSAPLASERNRFGQGGVLARPGK